MRFKTLLDAWGNRQTTELTDECFSIRLSKDDAARLDALAGLFAGIETEQVITDLLSASLDEVQAAMPYVPGERVIREDEFGDPVYEDVGLTPRFLELTRQHRTRRKQ